MGTVIAAYSDSERRALSAYTKLMRAAESITGRTSRILAASNLTVSQFGILEVLFHKGPLCQRELAAKILKSTGNITMVIDNLVKQNLVRRARDHGALHRIRRARRAHRQLRRHFRQERHAHADLRRRDGPPDPDLALGADVRARRGHRGGGGGGQGRGRPPRLRDRAEGHDRPEAARVQAQPGGPRRL